jgi:hypothetical protein
MTNGVMGMDAGILKAKGVKLIKRSNHSLSCLSILVTILNPTLPGNVAEGLI